MPTSRSQTPDQAQSARLAWQRPGVSALLGYVALAALFYSPILLGLRTFPNGDFTYHFLPFSLFQRSELVAGRLPLWNPYTYAGHPFLADVQAAVYYPLSNLLLALTLPWASLGARLYWLQVEAVLHVALAGFFTYLLVHELTTRRSAALLAGCVFAFSGYLTGYPPLQLAVLRTAIWLPLVLWLLLRAFREPAGKPSTAGRGWRWWIGAALAYATAFLAGHSQTFLFVSYAVGAWILLLAARALRRSAAGMTRTAYVGRIAAFYAVFLGLSAAQLLPSLEFTRLSVRASVDYAFLSGGFPVSDTWQMLLPRVLTVFSPLYVGIVPLGLALLAVFLAPHRADATAGSPIAGADTQVRPNQVRPNQVHPNQVRPKQIRPKQIRPNPAQPSLPFILYFAGLALIGLLVSYGANGFLYAVFYRLLPGWNLFRGQERAAYLVAFGLSALAGFGADILAAAPFARRRARVLAYVGAALVGIALFAAFWQVPGRSTLQPAQFYWIAGAAAALLLLFAWLFGFDRPRRWLSAGLIALAVADLFLANFTTNVSNLGPALKTALPREAQALADAVRAQGNVNLGLPGRAYNEYRVFDDYGMRAGVEDVWGSSPLRLARYAALFEAFPLDRMWRLTGVDHALTWRRDLPPEAPGELLAEFPQATDTTYLHRLSQVNPRAWVVSSVQQVSDADALRLLADSGFDLARSALVPLPGDPDGGGDPLLSGLLAPAGRNDLALERLAPGHLRIRVNSENGGLLVVSENWMPGWRALERREGQSGSRALSVLRADLAFLGIPIEPGQGVIDLVYRPASAWGGLTVSALMLAGLGLGAFLRRRRGANVITSPGGVEAPGLARIAAALLPAAILLLAWGLRLYRLGYQELRGDEVLGYLFRQDPAGQIIQFTVELREPHPVGSYLIQQAWEALTGNSEFALRFLSAWFGILAVVMLYRLARELGFGKPGALLAAGLAAISPYAIWHSQDARMYSMSLALTLASTVLAWRALGQRRWLPWLAYVGVSLLALHVHYYAAFAILAQNLYFIGRALVVPGHRRDLRPWVSCQFALGLLYLPWLLAARGTLAGYYGNGDSPGLLAMWARAISVFAAGESAPYAQRTVMAILGSFLLVAGAARLALAGRGGRLALGLLSLYLAVPLLATWASALSRPIFNERYLAAAAPPFYLLLAAAVLGYAPRPHTGADGSHGPAPEGPAMTYHKQPRGAQRALAALSVLALGLVLLGALASLGRYYFVPEYSKTRGWREVAALLDRFSAGLPAERVMLVDDTPDPTLWYYYAGPVAHRVLPPAANDTVGAEQEVSDLVAAGVERVVAAMQPAEGWDNGFAADAALGRQYTPLATYRMDDWGITIYARSPRALTPLDATFRGGLAISKIAIQNEHLVPGDLLVAHLNWRVPAGALHGTEKVTIQLLNADGKLVAQTDAPISESYLDAGPVPYVVPLPLILPAGSYRVIAAVYDPALPGAPRLPLSDGRDYVELGTLEAGIPNVDLSDIG